MTHGAGTSPAAMAAELPPLVLDVSRLVSRIGTGPLTGIDRVEAAWLDHLQGRPHLLICRITRAQALLPADAGAAILRWIGGATDELPARPGWRERLAGRRDITARAHSALRKRAIHVAPASGRGLMAHIRRALPGAAACLNLGHANLHPALLAELGGLTRAVMIHDTIPLDHPEFTRAGQSDRFRERLVTALSLADVILTVSQATAMAVDLWRRRLAVTRRAPIIATPIGTTLTPADTGAVPADLDFDGPFFVTLGTVEPRKNHALLLDCWEMLAASRPAVMPRLLILGRRGWDNHAVLARLDALTAHSPVIWRENLPDAAVAALMSRARALLMPSYAEGFGLPLTEAAGRGIPVLCAPLPVARELLGEYPHYLSPDDPAAWAQAISALPDEGPDPRNGLAIIRWDVHFDTVAAVISACRLGIG
ncbi:MAG: glycosyltransferase family 1 protein [Paracoccus sp. (in: a-proteobacteria)]|nr:glycosyltransferase family 1 protein [Paracoccus sp. (in: a-proteobacteria)]